MEVNEIAELLGKAILLLNKNKSRTNTSTLLRLGGYDSEQIKSVFDYIDTLDLPKI